MSRSLPLSASTLTCFYRRIPARAPAFAASLVSLAISCSSMLAQAPQYHAPVVAANNTLSGVSYNNRYEVSGGFAYSHFDAGPSLLQGSNLGGIDIEGARFFTRKWAADASARAYLGTSGAAPNAYMVRGPFVSEYMLLGGPEYRALSNQHASLTLHALFGGTYGYFSSAFGQTVNGHRTTTDDAGLYNDQFAFAGAIGGSIDLNRSPRLAFRITPEALLTDYHSLGKGDFKEQFGLSVGLVYRLGRHIDPDRPGTPARPTH